MEMYIYESWAERRFQNSLWRQLKPLIKRYTCIVQEEQESKEEKLEPPSGVVPKMKSGGGEEFEVGFFGNQGFGEVEKSSPEEVRTSISPVLEDWNTGLAISCVRFDVNDSHCFLRSSLERHLNEPFVGSIQHGAVRIMEECPNFRNAYFTNKKQCVFEGLNKMVANDEGNGCSLKIKVIDETAVIETISGNRFRIGNEEEDHVGFGKYSERIDEKNITKQETHARKKKRPRRRGKGTKNMSRSTNPVEHSPNHTVESHLSRQEKSKDTKRAYSREELMAMRSVNLEEQRKKWIQAYCGLEPTVAREYDGLVGCNRQKHIQVNFDPRKQCSYKDLKAPGLLGTGSLFHVHVSGSCVWKKEPCESPCSLKN